MRLNREILQNADMSQYPPYPTCGTDFLPTHWHSVKDELPRLEQNVLIWDGNFIDVTCYGIEFINGEWTKEPVFATYGENVTHWLSLPEPPK